MKEVYHCDIFLAVCLPICQKSAFNFKTHFSFYLRPTNNGYGKLNKVLPSLFGQIMPLFKQKEVSGEKLFEDLRREAEEVRKEKKRNTFSGIHK